MNMLSTASEAPAKIKGGIKGGIKGQAAGRSDVFMVDPRLIEIDPEFNARDFSSPANIAHVEWLEGSIASEGIKEPLKAYTLGSRIIITNGESRLRAVRNLIAKFEATGGAEGANIETVPVRTEERFTNDADRLFTQLTSNSGKRFEVMEQSDLFVKMVKLGVSVEQIAIRANLDKRRVISLLDYQALPTEVKQMIRDERITASLAWTQFLSNSRDDEQTISVLREAVDNAAAAGRTKASNKFVGGKGGERVKSEKIKLREERAELLGLFDGALVVEDELTEKEIAAGEELTVTVSMTADKWARIVDLLGL